MYMKLWSLAAEINVGVTTERQAAERQFEAPTIDLNYDLGDRIQFKYKVPYMVSWSNSNFTQGGQGDTLLAVKYRIFDDKKPQFEFSTYPQMDLNNNYEFGSPQAGRARFEFLLPLDVTKRLGSPHVSGEAGYWFHARG
jgi:hypothetical protein